MINFQHLLFIRMQNAKVVRPVIKLQYFTVVRCFLHFPIERLWYSKSQLNYFVQIIIILFHFTLSLCHYLWHSALRRGSEHTVNRSTTNKKVEKLVEPALVKSPLVKSATRNTFAQVYYTSTFSLSFLTTPLHSSCAFFF